MNLRTAKCAHNLVLALLLLIPAASASAQAPPAQAGPKLTLLRELIRAREPGNPPLFHAVFEVEVTGPASAFPLPREWQGEQFRQVNIQEWWAQDSWVAVVTHAECTVWLDGKVVVSNPSREEPDFTYVNDGERIYYLETRGGQRFLGVNATWPYRNCAYPVFFGRTVSARSFGEILDNGVDYLGRSTVEGHPCSAVSFSDDGRVSTRAWLAEDLQGLCTRREVHGSRGLMLEESYKFAAGPRGIVYPNEGTQRQFNARGQARTTIYRARAFDVDTPVPPRLLALSPEDADIVFDVATGRQLKPAMEGQR